MAAPLNKKQQLLLDALETGTPSALVIGIGLIAGFEALVWAWLAGMPLFGLFLAREISRHKPQWSALENFFHVALWPASLWMDFAWPHLEPRLLNRLELQPDHNEETD